MDAIVHVVRCFEDTNIIHVDGSIDPARDIETINLELIFSDIEILDRRIAKISKQARMDKTLAKELELVEAIKAPALVRELNNVDFPTFGSPTIPNFIMYFTCLKMPCFQAFPPFYVILLHLIFLFFNLCL